MQSILYACVLIPLVIAFRSLRAPSEGVISGTVVSAGVAPQCAISPMRLEGSSHILLDLTVGGQKVPTLFDTGSSDLLIIGKACANCSKVIRSESFDPDASHTHSWASETSTHTFGSGPVSSRHAFDSVSIPGFHSASKHQSIWEAVSQSMPMLAHGAQHFHAILGASPRYVARLGQPTTLRAMGIQSFMVRFSEKGEKPTNERTAFARVMQPSLVIDATPPPHSLTIKILGDFHWAVPFQGFAVDWTRSKETHKKNNGHDVSQRENRALQLSCPVAKSGTAAQASFFEADKYVGEEYKSDFDSGCVAVFDTGTAQIAMSRDNIQAVKKLVGMELDIGCKNVAEFPDLIVNMGINGSSPFGSIRLPPRVYISRSRVAANVEVCSWGFTLLNVQTQYGPGVIFGLPVMKEIGVMFNLAQRSLTFARNEDISCKSSKLEHPPAHTETV